jgi:hypothetical protein
VASGHRGRPGGRRAAARRGSPDDVARGVGHRGGVPTGPGTAACPRRGSGGGSRRGRGGAEPRPRAGGPVRHRDARARGRARRAAGAGPARPRPARRRTGRRAGRRHADHRDRHPAAGRTRIGHRVRGVRARGAVVGTARRAARRHRHRATGLRAGHGRPAAAWSGAAARTRDRGPLRPRPDDRSGDGDLGADAPDGGVRGELRGGRRARRGPRPRLWSAARTAGRGGRRRAPGVRRARAARSLDRPGDGDGDRGARRAPGRSTRAGRAAHRPRCGRHARGRPLVRPVVRVRPVRARHQRDRGARPAAHRAPGSSCVAAGRRRTRDPGRGAGGLLAGDDPAVGGAPDLRGAGEPAGGAVRAGRHGGRARRVWPRSGVAGGCAGARGRRVGPGCRRRGHRTRGGCSAVRLGTLAGRGARCGRRRAGVRLHRGRRAGPGTARLPVAARRRGRGRGRCRSGHRAGARRPGLGTGRLVGRRVRRRAGGRRAAPWRRRRRAGGHRRRRRRAGGHRRRRGTAPGVPGPARGHPDRPARPDALRPRPRRRGGRGGQHRRDRPGRPRRPCVGRTCGRRPPGCRCRRPDGGRPGLRHPRAADLARRVAPGEQPRGRQRREHRAGHGTGGRRLLCGVPDRGPPRRPGGVVATSAPGLRCAAGGADRRREGRAPRLGGPGPAALPAAHGAGRTHRGRRGQHLRAPDAIVPRHTRGRGHGPAPYRRTRHRGARPLRYRRGAGVDGALVVGGRP